MMASITVRVTAGHVNAPLDPANVFVGSAATVGVIDVPRTRFGCTITGVTVAIENAAGTIVSVAASNRGNVWTATFPATHFAATGEIEGGLSVSAVGRDENGTTRTWVIGRGDVRVLALDAVPTPGTTVTHITDKTFDGQTVDITTEDGMAAGMKKLLETLGATVVTSLALCLAAFGGVPAGYTNDTYTADGVTWARHGALNVRTAYVVTNVVGGTGGGVTTNDVCAIVTNDVGGAAWVTNVTATSGGKEVTLLNVKWEDVEGIEQWLMYLRVPGIGDQWRASAAPNSTDPNAQTLAAMEYPELVTTRGAHNALGLAYERDVRPTISNTVTAAYVESLGITAGLTTNDVDGIIASSNLASVAYVDDAFAKKAENPTSGNIATVDNSGDLVDSGKSFATSVSWATTDNDVLTGKTVYDNFLRASYNSSSGNERVTDWVEFCGLAQFESDVRVQGSGSVTFTYGPEKIRFREGNILLPAYLDSLDWRTTGNHSLASYGITNALPPDTSAAVSALTATSAAHTASIAANSNSIAFWDGYWQGNRVRLSVTNYYGNTSGDLPRLRIEESQTNADGEVTGWITVWDEDNKYTNLAATVYGYMNDATNALALATWRMMNQGLATAAPRAWQTVTSAGEAAPDNTVWHTAPSTVFAGGTEYVHVSVGEGTICVLANNGASVCTEGEEGKFRFQDDSGTYYFGFDVSTAYTLGCNTDGITTTSVGGSNLVTLNYNLTSSSRPVIEYTTNLTSSTTWTELAAEEVSWSDPAAGVQQVEINAGSSPQGFYRAKLVYAGSAKFLTNMPFDPQAGILATNTVENVMQCIRPKIGANNVITWEVIQ